MLYSILIQTHNDNFLSQMVMVLSFSSEKLVGRIPVFVPFKQ